MSQSRENRTPDQTMRELVARVAELEDALKLIATFPPEGYHRRTDEGYPSEVVYDRFAYERMIDTYREVATTALKG